MSSKDRQKQIQDKCQTLLSQMLRDDDNKYCVDCDAKGPRWASWNLGIFLCIRCAGIHRNLGVHISKVKSVNLDTWTPEQVVSLQSMGNSRARAVYEANLPDTFRRPQSDSALEAFIRAKYEAKKYIAREWVQPPLPKVNWDKELEEEEKLRRKKREGKSASSIPAAPTPRKVDNVIPQPLPKPQSSPKTQRNTPPSARHKPQQPAQQSTDLLGLDTPVTEVGPSNEDDMFSSFLSAPPTQPTVQLGQQQQGEEGTGGVLSAGGLAKRTEEEENFFNQTSGSNGRGAQDKKLTTDSILALYAKGQPQQPQPTHIGTGGFVQPQLYCQPPAYHLQNGIVPPQSNPQVQGTASMFGAGVVNPMSVAASNPFYNMAVAATVAATTTVPQPPSQPFVQQNRLTQQMSGLSLGQAPPSGLPLQQQPQLFQPTAMYHLNNHVQPQQQQMPPVVQPHGGVGTGHTLANNLWQ